MKTIGEERTEGQEITVQLDKYSLLNHRERPGGGPSVADVVDKHLTGRVIPEDARKPLAASVRETIWRMADYDECTKLNGMTRDEYRCLARQLDPPPKTLRFTIELEEWVAEALRKDEAQYFSGILETLMDACKKALK